MHEKVKAQARLIYEKYQTLLLDKHQTCQVLNMSIRTLENLRKDCKAPEELRADGGKVLFEIHDLSGWIEANKS